MVYSYDSIMSDLEPDSRYGQTPSIATVRDEYKRNVDLVNKVKNNVKRVVPKKVTPKKVVTTPKTTPTYEDIMAGLEPRPNYGQTPSIATVRDEYKRNVDLVKAVYSGPANKGLGYSAPYITKYYNKLAGTSGRNVKIVGTGTVPPKKNPGPNKIIVTDTDGTTKVVTTKTTPDTVTLLPDGNGGPVGGGGGSGGGPTDQLLTAGPDLSGLISIMETFGRGLNRLGEIVMTGGFGGGDSPKITTRSSDDDTEVTDMSLFAIIMRIIAEVIAEYGLQSIRS